MDRRNYLKVGGAALGTGLFAGCIGGDGDNSGGSRGGNGTAGDTGGSGFGSHPSTADISSRPKLGSSDATASIVAFEDPSCPRCKQFNLGPFKKIKNNLIDEGKVEYYMRVIPVVYDWGKPACECLETTYQSNKKDFWGLEKHYFENQLGSGGSTEKLYSMTKSYLQDNTDLDAEKIVKQSKNRKYHDRIQDNLNAADVAGVQGTPTFFLFKNEEYLTKVSGPQSYSVFKNSLNL